VVRPAGGRSALVDYRRAVPFPDGNRTPAPRRIRSPDGVELAAYDLGGTGPDLLVVHATGFCTGVLAPLAGGLADRFHCWGVDLRGHGSSERPNDGNFAWSGFAADVLTAVDLLGLERPIGFGHSCGGASLLLAEEARPGTFAALYCYEPVVFPEPPATDREENPLSVGARRRRETFPSPTDAFVNFSSKPPFAALDPDVLRRYIDCGFEQIPGDKGGDGTAIRLRCRREDEAAVYAHGASHGAFAHLDRVTCPVALRCGASTDSFGPAILDQVAQRLPSATVGSLPDLGHFGPLERPEIVAGSMRTWFDGMTTPPAT